MCCECTAEGFWLSKSGWLELHLCVGLESIAGLGSATELESAILGLGPAAGLGSGAVLGSAVVGLGSATGIGSDIVGLRYARIHHNSGNWEAGGKSSLLRVQWGEMSNIQRIV